MKFKKNNVFALMVLGIILASGCVQETGKEQACLDSGGSVVSGMCCKSVGDYPDLCLVGACGCSPDNSHEVKVCDCGEGKCFNGSDCISVVNSFDECIDAGYPVMESFPRQCRTPDGRTFTEETGYDDIGIANPASFYCEKLGGKLRIVETPEGQAGYCALPDGRVCDEWRFYSSKGSECLPLVEEEYGVAEFMDDLCNQDSDCVTPAGYLISSHCPYTSKCIDGRCAVVCPSTHNMPKEFCGRSTYGSCSTDDDCITGGCSGQVCQSKNEEPITTTCEYRDCYKAEDYGLNCRCADKKCQWAA